MMGSGCCILLRVTMYGMTFIKRLNCFLGNNSPKNCHSKTIGNNCTQPPRQPPPPLPARTQHTYIKIHVTIATEPCPPPPHKNVKRKEKRVYLFCYWCTIQSISWLVRLVCSNVGGFPTGRSLC